MRKEFFEKITNKIQDHMLIGSIYDDVIKKTKYRDERLSFLYNVMMAQKHRMLYYKQLKKAYLIECTAQRPWEEQEKKFNPDTIWVMWLQGIENAPEIVKVCSRALKKNFPEKKLIFLDEKNISEYIQLPEYIMDKWKEGIISNAHFSDLIRLELLIRYGGYWIDATVLCTNADFLKKIEYDSLFMYSFYYFGFNPEIMTTNNWLVYSTTNNNILCLEQKFLYRYWKKRNRAVDYFLFHLFMTIASEYYEEEFHNMPIVSQVDAHVLASYIYDPFDQHKYDVLKLATGIHKLSTRFEEDKLGEDTFYDVIIRREKY